MKYWAGPLTISATGVGKKFAVGFQPTWAILTVCGKASDTACHTSRGVIDTTNYQYCQSTFMDTYGGKSINTETKCVSHYERVAGNIQEILSASFNSFYTTGIKLDVTIANTSYQVLIECGN